MRIIDPRRTLNRYRGPLVVYEAAGMYQDHLWRQVKQPDRTIQAVVLNISAQRMKILSDGGATVGGLTIHTTDTLYFLDVKSLKDSSAISNQPGVDSLTMGLPSPGKPDPRMNQSYVSYKNLTYRVIGQAFASNTTYKTYLATRYVSNESDGSDGGNNH